MSWLLVLDFAKRIGSAALTWLSQRSFWQLVCIGLTILLVIMRFQIADARHDRDAWRRQYDTVHAQIDKADKAVRDAQATIAKLTREIRNRSDEENRRIAGDADAVRVSGPGKATCRPAAAASGQHEQASGNGDAARPQVPSDDRGAVPWGWLVQRAEQADLNRAEVLAWRDWYQRLVENWPK